MKHLILKPHKPTNMFAIESYSVAVIFCVVTMLCWGSWANTQKLAGTSWRFELFYWDYTIGNPATTEIINPFVDVVLFSADDLLYAMAFMMIAAAINATPLKSSTAFPSG